MIVPYLALVLFAPWFAILGWAYWNYPRAHVAGGWSRRFDVATLAAYHAFLAVLVVAWFVRPRIHRP